MKKVLEKIGKKRIFLMLFLILFGIIFFSYNIATTWDSSEYLGMADFIRNGEIVENWIGHRGFMFPFIIFLAQPFGIKNKIFILALMYIFWIRNVFKCSSYL